MLPKKNTVVTPEKFDRLFENTAIIAEFATPEAEDEYVKRDSFLIHLIQEVTKTHFGSDEENRPHIMEDWWPNYTRYIDASLTQFRAAYLVDLYQLLADEYQDYRIQICVYGDSMEGSTYVGSMVLRSDSITVEKALNTLLQKETKKAEMATPRKLSD